MNKGSTSPANVAGVLILFLMLWAIIDPLKVVLSNLTGLGGVWETIFGIVPIALGILILANLIPNQTARGV